MDDCQIQGPVILSGAKRSRRIHIPPKRRMDSSSLLPIGNFAQNDRGGLIAEKRSGTNAAPLSKSSSVDNAFLIGHLGRDSYHYTLFHGESDTV